MLEVPHPATIDNVATGKKFKLRMELNFPRVMELFSGRRVNINAQKCAMAGHGP